MQHGSATALVVSLAAALLACQPATRLAPGVPPRPKPTSAQPAASHATPVADKTLAAELRREGGSRVGPTGASLLGLDGGSLIQLPPSALVRVAPKGSLIGVDGGTLIGVDGGSLIGVDGGTLIGVDGGSLIGVDGGSLIGVDGGSLIGVDGGSLIGVDGGSLIGVDGGSLTGRVELPAGLVGPRAGYHLASTAPAAGVRVYVRDARGRFFVGTDGKLVSAVTNQEGAVAFPGYRVARGLSLYVPLDAADGVLRGFAGLRPRTQPAGVPVPITPSATLLAGWVETQVLAGQPDPAAALDRLTPEAARLADEAARAALSAEALAGAAWRPDRLAAAANAAGEKHQALATALEEVRRVMTLAGVAGCEVGQPATAALLRRPRAVTGGPGGAIYVVSEERGRNSGALYRLAGQPLRVERLSGHCAGELEAPTFAFLVRSTDGAVLAVSGPNEKQGQVWRVAPDGKQPPAPWAGGGTSPAAPGVAGQALGLDRLTAAAAAAGGGAWLVETLAAAPGQPAPQRLVRLDAEGVVQDVKPLPDGSTPGITITALAQTPDGALWGLQRSEVWRFEPETGAWQVVWRAEGQIDAESAGMLAMPDGSVLLATTDLVPGGIGGTQLLPGDQHVIHQLWSDKKAERFAGAGSQRGRDGRDPDDVPAAEAHFSQPSGLGLDERDHVLVADLGNGLVRRIDPAGSRVVRVAGSQDAELTLARKALFDSPFGVALDDGGGIWMTEMGSHSLRQLKGDQMVRFAGGRQGLTPDGEVASALSYPSLLAVTGRHLLVADSERRLLRRIDRDTKRIETLTGGGGKTAGPAQPAESAQVFGWQLISGLTVDAEGRPIFVGLPLEHPGGVLPAGMVWRIEKNGDLTHLAGSGVAGFLADLDGKPARQAPLSMAAGVAVGPHGDTFIAEVVSGKVWRLDPGGLLHHVAGGPTWSPDDEAPQRLEMPATEATLAFPMGLACDGAGNVYVTEAGPRGIRRLTQAGSPLLPGTGVGALVGASTTRGRVRCLTPDGRAIIRAGAGASDRVDEADFPLGIAADRGGRVVFVDHGTGQLKELVRGKP
ncbi:MAG: hypothetical protein VKS61_13775 [Candidatus Sericytochromatia bacterium]|nr:hypothetical protein [Candidatus Sericytochromatia bacterium]